VLLLLTGCLRMQVSVIGLSEPLLSAGGTVVRS